MKSLFVSTNYPVEPERAVHGSFQRMRLFVDVLAEMGELTMLFFTPGHVEVDEQSTRAATAKMREFWGVDLKLKLCPRAETPSLPGVRGLLRQARSFENQIPYAGTAGAPQIASLADSARDADLLFAHRLNVMPAVLRLIDVCPTVVLDMDDVDHIRVRRSLTRRPAEIARLAQLARIPALILGEYRALKRARVSFVCSERDRRRLDHLFPGTRIEVVENAVEFPERVSRCPDDSLVFVGSFNYGPNVEAARELIREIWPRVRSECPQARLRIAGRGSRERLTSPPGSGVELLGFVEDLSDLYESSSVMVCPIRRGSGTRIKIIEAAAYGVPVVSTHIGAEGLDFTHGRDIVLADRAPEIADACIGLLTDPRVASQLAGRARRVVETRYSRSAVQSKIRGIVRATVR